MCLRFSFQVTKLQTFSFLINNRFDILEVFFLNFNLETWKLITLRSLGGLSWACCMKYPAFSCSLYNPLMGPNQKHTSILVFFFFFVKTRCLINVSTTSSGSSTLILFRWNAFALSWHWHLTWPIVIYFLKSSYSVDWTMFK